MHAAEYFHLLCVMLACTARNGDLLSKEDTVRTDSDLDERSENVRNVRSLF